MKTRLLRLSALAILLTLFLGCCEDCDQIKKETDAKFQTCEDDLNTLESYLNTPFVFGEYIPSMFDFCNTKESIIPKHDYNTKTGIANFSVPIPKGSNLKFLKKQNDTLYYECNGHGKISYSAKDLIHENKTVTGLPRKEGHGVWVSLIFKNFKDDTCSELVIYQEKKKTSEVQGAPLVK